MLRRIKLLCGWSGVSWTYSPGALLDVPEQVAPQVAARLVADGAAVPVEVERAVPDEAPPASPEIEFATVEPPEAAVLRRRSGRTRKG